jgi:hypothetical protein
MADSIFVEFGRFVYSSITSTGGYGLLWLALNAILSVYFAARVNKDVSHTYDKRMEEIKTRLKTSADSEIEIFKGQLAEVRSIGVSATSAFASAHLATTSKRVTAVEQLWAVLIDMKDECFKLIAQFEALSTEELAEKLKLNGSQALEAARKNLNKESNEFVQKYTTLGLLEKNRLFISDELWVLCGDYRLIMIRVVFMYREYMSNGRLFLWKEDEAIKDLCANLMSKEQMGRLSASTSQMFVTASTVAEDKILKGAREWVSGRLAADMAIAETSRIRKLIDSEIIAMSMIDVETANDQKKP